MQHWSRIAGNGCDSDIQRKQMPQSPDHQRLCISEINICKVLLEKKSQQICISNINSHLFFPVWPSNKIGSLTQWHLSYTGLFLLELTVSQLPHTKVGSAAAPGTFCTQRMDKLQMPWGQDPFTDSKPVWLKPHADSRKEPGSRLQYSWDRNVTLDSVDQSWGFPSPP